MIKQKIVGRGTPDRRWLKLMASMEAKGIWIRICPDLLGQITFVKDLFCSSPTHPPDLQEAVSGALERIQVTLQKQRLLSEKKPSLIYCSNFLSKHHYSPATQEIYYLGLSGVNHLQRMLL